MNTDKVYEESLANEYAPKDTSKVVALRKLDAKAPQALCVDCGMSSAAYMRPDGVYVVPITALKN